MSYGLRFMRDGKRVKLLQISGGTSFRLSDGQKEWWCRPPSGVLWEVYEASDGQTYPTRDEAETVARNLSR